MKVIGMIFVVLFEGLFSAISKGFMFVFEPLIIFISRNILPIVVGLSAVAFVVSMWFGIFMHEPDIEEVAKAKSFIDAGYPKLECTATNGGKRIYEAGTYSVEQRFDVGYNVHWTKIPCTDKTSFHVNKCEIVKAK